VGLAALVAVLAVAGAVLAAGGERQEPRRGGGGWDSTLAQSPFKRSEVGAARIGDRIYLVGGLLASGRTTGRMAAYDISEDEWQVLSPVPRPVNHPGATAMSGKLYVLGGQRGGDRARSRALWRYVPKADRWHRLPDAPSARAAMGFAARDGKLYAVGGQTSGNFELRRLEVYDVGLRRWRSRTPMRKGRNHLAAVWADGSLWAIGGRTEGENLARVERWMPQTDTWRNEPSLQVPRGGIAAVVARRSIVVFGGEDLSPGGSTIAEVECLPLEEPDAWQPLDPMPVPRHGLGGAAKGAFVYALEGGTEPGLSTSNLVERLDLAGVSP
jgi:N-acetylneuraminic acid mutarotase